MAFLRPTPIPLNELELRRQGDLHSQTRDFRQVPGRRRKTNLDDDITAAEHSVSHLMLGLDLLERIVGDGFDFRRLGLPDFELIEAPVVSSFPPDGASLVHPVAEIVISRSAPEVRFGS